MSDKQIRITMHAAERAYQFKLDSMDIEKIIRDGKRVQEGKTKTRYVLRTKRGVLVAICEESSELVMVRTITKGR